MKSLPFLAYPFCFACACAVSFAPFYFIYQIAQQQVPRFHKGTPVIPIELVTVLRTHNTQKEIQEQLLSPLPPTPKVRDAVSAIPLTPAKLQQSATTQLEEQPPDPVLRIEPIYPANALKQGIEGWVELEFILSEKGAVLHPKVIQSHPNSVFEQSVLDAIIQWRYPASSAHSSQKRTARIEFRIQ